MAAGMPSRMQSGSYFDTYTYNIEQVDSPPTFPGGFKAFQEYCFKNIKYTNEAITNKIEGKLHFTFKIDYDGNVKNVKIIRGLGYGLDEIVKQIIKDSPKWNAAVKNGQKVSCKFSYYVSCYLPQQ